MTPDLAFGALVDFARILDRHQIIFWLDGGTLLGAYRDGDFPPDDHDDIDLSTHATYKHLIPAIIEDAKEAGFYLYHHWTGDDRAPGMAQEISVTRDGNKIDLFFYEDAGDISWCCIYQDERCLPCLIPTALISSLTPLVFRQHQFLMPSRIDDYLAYRYGDWRTPVHRSEYSSTNPEQLHAVQPDWPFWEYQ